MSTFKKIPLWAKIVFPVGLVLAALYFLMNRGRSAWPWEPPSSPDGPGASPSITPKVAEEKREEVKEEKEDERDKIREEAKAMRDRLNG